MVSAWGRCGQGVDRCVTEASSSCKPRIPHMEATLPSQKPVVLTALIPQKGRLQKTVLMTPRAKPKDLCPAGNRRHLGSVVTPILPGSPLLADRVTWAGGWRA